MTAQRSPAPAPGTYTPARVYLEDQIGPFAAEVMVRRRWNGWSCPRFTREQTEQIVRRCMYDDAGNLVVSDLSLTWDGDVVNERTGPTREQAVEQLRAADWPSVADDLADGVSREVLLERLADLGAGDPQIDTGRARAILASLCEDDDLVLHEPDADGHYYLGAFSWVWQHDHELSWVTAPQPTAVCSDCPSIMFTGLTREAVVADWREHLDLRTTEQIAEAQAVRDRAEALLNPPPATKTVYAVVGDGHGVWADRMGDLPSLGADERRYRLDVPVPTTWGDLDRAMPEIAARRLPDGWVCTPPLRAGDVDFDQEARDHAAALRLTAAVRMTGHEPDPELIAEVARIVTSPDPQAAFAAAVARHHEDADVQPTEARSRALQRLLTERGVLCFLHWDRGPWGVRIPLTDDPSEYAAALYVITEGVEEVAGFRNTWVWSGQLGGFTDHVQTDLYETTFRWIERHWQGAGVESVADFVVPIVRLLVAGAAAAETGWAADAQRQAEEVAGQ